MLKYNVVVALENVAEARSAWARRHHEFRENIDLIMRRLINEAAVNLMSTEEVAESSGMTVKNVRSLMRYNNLNPKNGKRLLAAQAAKNLLANAELLDKEPHEFDLMSPLAYLPMGKALREELAQSQTPSVTEVEEIPSVYKKDSDEFNPEWLAYLDSLDTRAGEGKFRLSHKDGKLVRAEFWLDDNSYMSFPIVRS